MGKANKIKYNIIMSLVKFRLLVMSLTYQNSFSTALSIGSYLFCLKMSQSHTLSPKLSKLLEKRVDLVMEPC